MPRLWSSNSGSGSGGGGGGNSFTTIQPDAGTSPVADNANDTLTLTSGDGSVLITGNSTTDTVAFTTTWSRVLGGGNTSGAHDAIMLDNQSMYFGTGSDGRIKYDNTNWLFDLVTTGGMYFTNTDVAFNTTAKMKFVSNNSLVSDPNTTIYGNVFSFNYSDNGYGTTMTLHGTVFNSNITLADRINAGFAVATYDGIDYNVTLTGTFNPASTSFFIPQMQGVVSQVTATGTFAGSFNGGINPYIYNFNSDGDYHPGGIAITTFQQNTTLTAGSYGSVLGTLCQLAVTGASTSTQQMRCFDTSTFLGFSATCSGDVITFRGDTSAANVALVGGNIISFKAVNSGTGANIMAFYAELFDPNAIAFKNIEGYWDNHTYNPFYFGATSESSLMYDGADFVLSTALSGTGVLKFGSAASFTANGTQTITISALGPAGIGTATIGKWLTIKDNAGTVYYIPCWT